MTDEAKARLKNIAFYGIAAIVGFVVYKKFGSGLLNFASARGGASAAAAAGPSVGGLPPAKVMARQKIEAATFQIINVRNPGKLYVSARMLFNGHVEFTSPQTGYFTRNVLRNGAATFAEVTPE